LPPQSKKQCCRSSTRRSEAEYSVRRPSEFEIQREL
jgi:hypothetical protein